MARKCSYSKRDLQVACSKTKKKIESDILSKKLTKSAINKTYVYSEKKNGFFINYLSFYDISLFLRSFITIIYTI